MHAQLRKPSIDDLCYIARVLETRYSGCRIRRTRPRTASISCANVDGSGTAVFQTLALPLPGGCSAIVRSPHLVIGVVHDAIAIAIRTEVRQGCSVHRFTPYDGIVRVDNSIAVVISPKRRRRTAPVNDVVTRARRVTDAERVEQTVIRRDFADDPFGECADDCVRAIVCQDRDR